MTCRPQTLSSQSRHLSPCFDLHRGQKLAASAVQCIDGGISQTVIIGEWWPSGSPRWVHGLLAFNKAIWHNHAQMDMDGKALHCEHGVLRRIFCMSCSSGSGHQRPFDMKASARFQAQQNWQECLQVLHGLSTDMVQTSVLRCNTVLGTLRNPTSWCHGMLLLGFMKRKILEPSVVSLNALSRGVALPRSWFWSFQVLDVMFSGHTQADTITCNTAISTCDREEQWSQAWLILDRFQYCGIEVRGPWVRLSWNDL